MSKKNDECIAIYSRKSKFTGKGESVENQIELCKKYICRVYGEEALDHVLIFEDEGYSGGNTNRPAFKKMMEQARKRKFKAIIVYRLDRISRNVGDFAFLNNELKDLDIEFVSISENFDTGSSFGEAMMMIASVFAQLERDTIRERITDNIHELAKTGRWMGGNVPLGYEAIKMEYTSANDKKKTATYLRLVPEEGEIVKTIFDFYLETESITLTDRKLLLENYKTKNGIDFNRYTIKSILINPAYMIADAEAYQFFKDHQANIYANPEDFDGTYGMNVCCRIKNHHTTQVRPINEWMVTIGRHEGLISGKRWVRVQELIERNKSKSYHNARKNKALLTGVIFCRCGSRMYPKAYPGTDEKGEKCFSYMCKMKERTFKALCDCENVNGNMFDEQVIRQIKLLSEDKDNFVHQLEKGRKELTLDRTNYDERLSVMKDQKKQLNKKIERLVDSLADMESSAARKQVSKRIDELNDQLVDAEAQIQELEGLISKSGLEADEFEKTKELLSAFSNSLEEMTIEQKRLVIRSVVRKIVWDGRNAHVILFGASDEEIEYPEITIPDENGNVKEINDQIPLLDTGEEVQLPPFENTVNEVAVKTEVLDETPQNVDFEGLSDQKNLSESDESIFLLCEDCKRNSDASEVGT